MTSPYMNRWAKDMSHSATMYTEDERVALTFLQKSEKFKAFMIGFAHDIELGISDDGVEAIRDLHNQLRSYAANMYEFKEHLSQISKRIR